MGTRQELGLFLLVLLLALPAAGGWLAGGEGTAEPVPACQRPLEIGGAVEQAGLVCDPAALEGLPAGCRLPADPKPGVRITVQNGPAGSCALERRPMSGAHLVLAGLGIDPNRATAEDLQVLPGIGPALSARIVADRQRRGPFLAIDDLERVRGIGPKTLARIRPFLRLDDEAPATRPR